MTTIDVSKLELTDHELMLVKIFVKNNGELRLTKPKLIDDHHRDAAFVWRHVMFLVSPKSEHHCMPVMCELELPNIWWMKGAHDLRRDHIKRLNKIVDAVVSQIPKNEWYGVHRWGRALGKF